MGIVQCMRKDAFSRLSFGIQPVCNDAAQHTCRMEIVYLLLCAVTFTLAQDAPSVLLPDYPSMAGDGMYLLAGGVHGMLKDGDVFTPDPWQAFKADSVHIYGYADYDGLVTTMNDPLYTPYKTETLEDGKQHGLVVITVVKYDNTTAGPYDEVVINAAASRKLRVVKGCSLDSMACHFREAFTTPDFKWYTLKMWLSEELPVAVGQQMFGINKSLADVLKIRMEPSNESNSNGDILWTMILRDTGKSYRADETPGSPTKMKITLQDKPQSMGGLIGLASDIISAFMAVMPDFGSTGEPTGVLDATQRFMAPLVSGGIVKAELIQPVGMYPPNFGDKNPIIESALYAKDGFYMSECGVEYVVSGYWDALGFKPIGCMFQKNLEGLILTPVNDPAFIRNVAKRTNGRSPGKQSTLG